MFDKTPSRHDIRNHSIYSDRGSGYSDRGAGDPERVSDPNQNFTRGAWIAGGLGALTLMLVLLSPKAHRTVPWTSLFADEVHKDNPENGSLIEESLPALPVDIDIQTQPPKEERRSGFFTQRLFDGATESLGTLPQRESLPRIDRERVLRELEGK